MNIFLFQIVRDKDADARHLRRSGFGKWMTCTSTWGRRLEWCLTSDPLRSWSPKTALMLCEGDGLINGDECKSFFARIRLIRQIAIDWEYLSVFPRIRAFLAASMRSRDPNCDISWVRLSEANLAEADLSWADLAGVDLYGVNLARSNLEWTALGEANLKSANLSNANMRNANLCRANMYGASLSGADLSDANLSEANLSASNLACANLDDANLEKANMANANVSTSRMAWANLSQANLTGVNMSESDLRGANLTGAFLDGANLAGSDLTGAMWSASVPPPAGWELDASGRLSSLETESRSAMTETADWRVNGAKPLPLQETKHDE